MRRRSVVAAAAAAPRSLGLLARPPALGPALLPPRSSLAGAAAGSIRLAAIDAPARRVRDGEHVSAAGPAARRRRGPGRSAPRPRSRSASGRLRGARLLLRAPAWCPFPRGAARRARELALRRPARRRLRRPARLDYDDYLRRRGVAGELALDRARATGRRRGGLAGALDRDARARRAGRGGRACRRARRRCCAAWCSAQDEAIDRVARDDFRATRPRAPAGGERPERDAAGRARAAAPDARRASGRGRGWRRWPR